MGSMSAHMGPPVGQAHHPRDLGPHLVQNGVDFLIRGVSQVNSTTETRSLKFAAVDIGAATEIFLKARLLREHWTLLCKDSSKARPRDFLAGTSFTVGPEDLLARLQTIAEVELPQQRKEELGQLFQLRNRAIHFTLAETADLALESTIGRGLSFILWFFQTELIPEATSEEGEILDEALDQVRAELSRISELVTHRMSDLQPILAVTFPRVVCPRCTQPTLHLDESAGTRCLFCLWDPDGDLVADEYVSTVLGVSHYRAVKDGDEYPLHQCPACDAEALVHGALVIDTSEGRPGPSSCGTDTVPVVWACFGCSRTFSYGEIDFCSRCGQPTEVTDDHGAAICTDCYSDLVARD